MLRPSTFAWFRASFVTTVFAGAGTLACTARGPTPTELGQVAQSLAVSAKAIGTDTPVPLQYSTGAYLGVASDGTERLLVFYDGGRIRAVRYDESGTVLDLDEWIRLGRNEEGADVEGYPDVAYGAGVFMVVYDDLGERAGGVYAQGVKPDGTLVSEPVLVGKDGLYGSIVFNGTDFTVAWYNGDLSLARVALDGTLVAGSTSAVTTGSTTNRPALAMAGDVGLVVFEQEVDGARQVYAARFDAAGKVLDPGGVLISDETTSSVDVSVAAGDSEFLAVWNDWASGTVVGSRIDFGGKVVAAEFPISRSTGSTRGSAVAYDGSQYLVVWSDTRAAEAAIYGTRLTAEGNAVDASDVQFAAGSRVNGSWDIDLTWDQDRYALAYVAEGIVGRFVGSDLTVMPPGELDLTVLPNAQLLSTAAWDGSQYVLGFSDERNDDADQFRSVHIDATGEVLTPEGIEISSATDRVGSLRVAHNGQTTLYTWWSWTDSGGAGYKRTRSASGILSEPEVWLSEAAGTSGAVSNGETFLASYSAGDNGAGNDNEIWVQPFDAAGAVSGPPVRAVTISRPRWLMEPLGDEYLLAYSGQEVGGAAITGSVLILSSTGTAAAEFDPVIEGMLTATAAGNGQKVLFSWQDATTDGLMGRLLDRTEGWSEPFVLADPVTEGVPAIAWDGTSFVVVWAEDKKAMWSRNVSPDGSLSEPERLFSGDYGFVHLTPGADGQLLLSYVRWLEWARSRRIESRLVGELGDGIAVLPRDTEIDAGTDPGQGTGGTGGTAPSTGGQSPTSTGGKAGGTASTGGSGAQGPAGSTGGSGASGPTDPGNGGSTTPGEDDAGKADDAGPSTSAPANGGAFSAPDDTAKEADAAAEAQSPATSRSADQGGCSVSRTSTRGGVAWLSVLLGALMLRQRRRVGYLF